MALTLPVPRRMLLLATAATTVFALAFMGPSASAERQTVDVRWKAVFSITQETEFVDFITTRGSPFGKGRVVTRTPRAQRSALIRTPTFLIRTKSGKVLGRLRVKKTYLRTTATSQTARYEGTGVFDGGTGRYRGARGTITRLFGVVTCFADGDCEGHLDVKGKIRY